MKITKYKGFTLIELIVVVAVLSVLVVGTIAFSGIISSSKEKVCSAQRSEAINVYEIYKANGGEYHIDGTVGMAFLAESRMLDKEHTCPSGGEYTWQVEEDGKLHLYCSVHGDLEQSKTPIGNNFGEITTSMIELIEEFYEENGRYPRGWGEYAYSDIGLSSEDWNKPIDHIKYGPGGNRMSIRPEEGYEFVVIDANGQERVLKESYKWNLWYDMYTDSWYYKTIAPENLIDIDTLLVREY